MGVALEQRVRSGRKQLILSGTGRVPSSFTKGLPWPIHPPF